MMMMIIFEPASQPVSQSAGLPLGELKAAFNFFKNIYLIFHLIIIF